MRRIAFWFVVAALTITTTAAFAAGGRTTDQQRAQIRFQHLENPKWTTTEVVKTIRAAVRRWPVEGGASKALSVAKCESGLDERASNGGAYLGVFQQSARYWPGRQNAYDSARWHLGERAFNARANVIVSIRMAHSSGWGDWSCA